MSAVAKLIEQTYGSASGESEEARMCAAALDGACCKEVWMISSPDLRAVAARFLVSDPPLEELSLPDRPVGGSTQRTSQVLQKLYQERTESPEKRLAFFRFVRQMANGERLELPAATPLEALHVWLDTAGAVFRARTAFEEIPKHFDYEPTVRCTRETQHFEYRRDLSWLVRAMARGAAVPNEILKLHTEFKGFVEHLETDWIKRGAKTLLAAITDPDDSVDFARVESPAEYDLFSLEPTERMLTFAEMRSGSLTPSYTKMLEILLDEDPRPEAMKTVVFRAGGPKGRSARQLVAAILKGEPVSEADVAWALAQPLRGVFDHDARVALTYTVVPSQTDPAANGEADSKKEYRYIDSIGPQILSKMWVGIGPAAATAAASYAGQASSDPSEPPMTMVYPPIDHRPSCVKASDGDAAAGSSGSDSASAADGGGAVASMHSRMIVAPTTKGVQDDAADALREPPLTYRTSLQAKRRVSRTETIESVRDWYRGTVLRGEAAASTFVTKSNKAVVMALALRSPVPLWVLRGVYDFEVEPYSLFIGPCKEWTYGLPTDAPLPPGHAPFDAVAAARLEKLYGTPPNILKSQAAKDFHAKLLEEHEERVLQRYADTLARGGEHSVVIPGLLPWWSADEQMRLIREDREWLYAAMVQPGDSFAVPTDPALLEPCVLQTDYSNKPSAFFLKALNIARRHRGLPPLQLERYTTDCIVETNPPSIVKQLHYRLTEEEVASS